MSRFYGTVVGAAQSNATRRGHNDIRVSAQSWNGSLITVLHYDAGGNLIVDLEHSDGSNTRGQTVFSGTMDDLMEKLKS